VQAAARLHGDDTTVPVLAKGKTITGRLWAYVRDDRPFAGPPPPAVLFHHARDRRGVHPEAHLAGYHGILQADAYGGFSGLYAPSRPGGTITEALCWAHARRLFFELADLARPGRTPASLAVEAVRRIDDLFAHERVINGQPAERRLAYRREHVAPLVVDFEAWLRRERPRLARPSEVAKAVDHLLKRWPAFTRFLDHGRDLPLEQRRGTRAARRGSRAKIVAVLRLGSRRAPRGGPAHRDRHGEAERHRSAGLARRRSRAHRRPPAAPPPRAAPLELAARHRGAVSLTPASPDHARA
jgi:transposase